MDDRELEARLRTRLHIRFDGAEPPASLHPVLADVAAPRLRALPRSASFAWLAVAALIVAIAAGLGLRGGSGPGAAPTDQPSPTPTVYPQSFIVLQPSGAVPSKATTTLAIDTLILRLRAIGVTNFTSGGGYAITFVLPSSADTALVRSILAANGVLSFVPLPLADYTSVSAVVGQPLPVAEPELFGRDQIAAAGVATSNGVPTSVHVDLNPPGADALATYSSAHIGETLAVLVDGTVAALPVIVAPITGGHLEISASDGPTPWFLAAIVTSGTLPDEWQDPIVPTIIPEGDARARALAWAAAPDVTVVSASLSTFGEPGPGAGPVPAWYVDLNRPISDPSCRPSPVASPVPPVCIATATNQVILDATTGAVLSPLP